MNREDLVVVNGDPKKINVESINDFLLKNANKEGFIGEIHIESVANILNLRGLVGSTLVEDAKKKYKTFKAMCWNIDTNKVIFDGEEFWRIISVVTNKSYDESGVKVDFKNCSEIKCEKIFGIEKIDLLNNKIHRENIDGDIIHNGTYGYERKSSTLDGYECYKIKKLDYFKNRAIIKSINSQSIAGGMLDDVIKEQLITAYTKEKKDSCIITLGDIAVYSVLDDMNNVVIKVALSRTMEIRDLQVEVFGVIDNPNGIVEDDEGCSISMRRDLMDRRSKCGSVRAGEQVKILDEKDKWYFVEYYNRNKKVIERGWCFGEFIKKLNEKHDESLFNDPHIISLSKPCE